MNLRLGGIGGSLSLGSPNWPAKLCESSLKLSIRTARDHYSSPLPRGGGAIVDRRIRREETEVVIGVDSVWKRRVSGEKRQKKGVWQGNEERRR
ncbi:hypothetical protein WN55_06376 [Dufourea novaeangliae]|uniref:Uncharacterized protein n=1 Tax=Dufourea novaeangliae TaxID=178035 RepID=A0A154PS22_DUFNO|nr:hypothetical protein WN55_06376 [Dufourea novaeangliae]